MPGYSAAHASISIQSVWLVEPALVAELDHLVDEDLLLLVVEAGVELNFPKT